MPWRNWQATKDYEGVNYIHPLKQRDVERLVDAVKKVPEIKAVVIFGSATEYRCTELSDIDALFVGRPTRPIDFMPLDATSEFDVHYWDGVPKGSLLEQEILRDGVVVYEASESDGR